MLQSRNILLLIGACAVPVSASAQGLGFKAGYSWSTVSTTGVLPGTLPNHSGFTLGAAISTPGLIGVGIEGLYAERGFGSATVTTSQRFKYIDVPAYLKVELPLVVASPYAYLGPQVSFELNCDDNGTTCPSGRNKTTFAGVIGAGARLGMVAGLSLEGRYVYGLTDLNPGTVTSTTSYKNRSFMVLAGISF